MAQSADDDGCTEGERGCAVERDALTARQLDRRLSSESHQPSFRLSRVPCGGTGQGEMQSAMTPATAPISTTMGRSYAARISHGGRFFRVRGGTKFQVTAAALVSGGHLSPRHAVSICDPGCPQVGSRYRSGPQSHGSVDVLALEREHCTGIDRPVSANPATLQHRHVPHAIPEDVVLICARTLAEPRRRRRIPDVHAVAWAAWLGRSGGLHSRPLPMSAFLPQGETTKKGAMGVGSTWQNQLGCACLAKVQTDVSSLQSGPTANRMDGRRRAQGQRRRKLARRFWKMLSE